MENKEKFQKFAAVLQVIAKIVFWIGVVGAAILALVAIIIKMPSIERLIHKGLQADVLNFSLSLKGVAFTLADFPVNEMIQIAFVWAIARFLTMLVVLFLIRELIRILEAVKSGVPFTDDSVKHIYRLGIGMIVYSVIVESANGLIASVFMQMSIHQDAVPNGVHVSANMLSVDTQILFAGLLVLLFGKIFQYGLFLQQEYDETV